jgi:hypothetical protein
VFVAAEGWGSVEDREQGFFSRSQGCRAAGHPRDASGLVSPFRAAEDYRKHLLRRTNLISSFLITTPKGHILLDTGDIQMLPQVEANIEKLGFEPKDVKFLLSSHATLIIAAVLLNSSARQVRQLLPADWMAN